MVVTTQQAQAPAAQPGRAIPTSGGELLRQWRQRRRRSQLDLALDTGVSARHLSFVETGRSQPSRGLLLALAEQLDVPLRERNALMLAAGYAPTYAQSDLDSAQTQVAREALRHLLDGHEPYLARLTGDPRLANLLTEVRTYPGVVAALDDYHEPVTAELLLTLQLAHPAGDLLLHSTVTSFGSPRDVTLSELTVESFFPPTTTPGSSCNT